MDANIWGIDEGVTAGKSCPLGTRKLPFYKRIFLFFFRFGICPVCMTMSIGYAVWRSISKRMGFVQALFR